MRKALWFVVGFLLSWITGTAFASGSFPATFAPPVIAASSFFLSGFQSQTTAASASAVCAIPFANRPFFFGGEVVGTNAGEPIYQSNCYKAGHTEPMTVRAACPGGYVEHQLGSSPWVGCKLTAAVSTYQCPANATLSGSTCTCSNPYVASGTVLGSTCGNPGCTGKTLVSEGLYPIGADPKARTPAIVCSNGCLASFSGSSPAATAVVSGQTLYYAKGNYTFMGGGSVDVCTPGSAGAAAVVAPAALNTPPADTCASGNYISTVGGAKKCFTAAGTEVPTTAPVSTGSGTVGLVTNPDGSKTVTTTTINNNNTSTVTTITYPPGIEPPATPSGTTTAETPSSDPDSDWCQKHPGDKLCADASSGAAAGTGGLYTSPDSKTFAGSISTFKNTVQAGGFYSAATGFFSSSVPPGTCTGLATTLDLMGHAVAIDLGDFFCGSFAQAFYDFLALGVLLGAAILAFSIAIL